MTLDRLPIGKSAVIQSVGGSGALRHHLLDMGLTPKTQITLRKVAPMGDPIELELRGYVLTLRLEDAQKIEISSPFDAKTAPLQKPAAAQPIAHPKHGESSAKRGVPVIAEGSPITIGLAGNQNCGKTTLFNQLTGSNQHVGNFPGVTVDRKDGQIRKHPHATVVDLPGIYSLSPYSGEEIVTRDFLVQTKPDAIINIVDATNIERNLYLTMQLLELEIPMVLALNMMDEMRANGNTIDVNHLEAELGIPVIPISAAKNEGIDELIEHTLQVARFAEKPIRQDFCSGAVHRCIHAISHVIEDHTQSKKIPTRFASSKLAEGDTLMAQQLDLSQNETELIEHAITEMEQECNTDRKAALADMRYTFIESLCERYVTKTGESREKARSAKADEFLTHRIFAIPIFLGIMALVFWLTFGVIGAGLSDLLAMGIDSFTSLCDNALTAYGINPVVHSLVIDGIFAGVGSVLGFLPTIITLFFFLSILEDSGYMARVAFVMDKLLRKIGLSGRSFVPMLVGFGCSVPAIMATRTLSSERDRKMTLLLTPFMSCSAKLPIYAVFTQAFFPKEYRAAVMVFLYVFGMVIAVLYGLLLKNSLFKGKPVPFVMELPNYRMPSSAAVGRMIWDKAKDFLTRAFTVIFIATIFIWFLQNFDAHLNVVTDSANSLLAMLGSLIAPLFAPLGFGDWRASTALITGFSAKEAVVSTLAVLTESTTATLPQALNAMFTPFTAFVFLVFTLLYTPCVAAIAAVKQELNSGKAAFLVALSQCGIAWVIAFAVRLIGSVMGFV